MRTGVQAATLCVEGLEHTGGRRDALGDGLERRMQNHARLKGILRIGHLLGDICGEILRWQLARGKARAGCERRLDAVDSKRAPIAATDIPGNEVPAASGVNEVMRFDGARGGL